MKKNLLIIGAAKSVQHVPDLNSAYEASGNNFGNLLIGEGARSVLSCNNIVNYSEGGSAEKMNESCDHVVIAASNFLWQGFDMSYLADMIEPLQLPVTIMGLGAQTSGMAEDKSIHPGTMRLISIVAERSKTIGVRGAYTADVLAHNGIHNVEIVGCPSLFSNRAPSISIDRAKLESLEGLVVNFSRRVVSHSFDKALMQKLENQLLKFALLHKSTFIAQDELAELLAGAGNAPITKEIRNYFSDLPTADVSDFFINNTRHFNDPSDWKAFVATRPACIGTRLHGAIAALVSGTPSMLIAHDSRTLEMAEAFQMPHLSLKNLSSGDDVNFPMLLEEADYSAFEARYREMYIRFAAFLDTNQLPHVLN